MPRRDFSRRLSFSRAIATGLRFNVADSLFGFCFYSDRPEKRTSYSAGPTGVRVYSKDDDNATM